MATALRQPPRAATRQGLLGLLALRRDPLRFFTSLAREHGDVVHFKFGPEDAYLLGHPDFVRDVLVVSQKKFMKGRGLQVAKRVLGEGLLTSEGEFHLRQRRLVQPAFHRQRIARYAEVMVDYAARTRERWERWPADKPLDIAHEMMRLTLVIAGKTLFDADVESEASDVGAALTETMSLFERVTNPLAPLLEKLPLPSNFRFLKAKQRLDEIIYGIINERRRSGPNGIEDRGDLLSMLLTAQDTEGDGGRMSDEQVRDEAMTLFLAGHETTANALAWAWYLISKHPEVEAKLHAEIDVVLQGRLPTYEDVPRLKYAEMVMAEAMRLYPPAWIVGRRALADHEIGGYLIPAKSLVLMSQYVVHRDARWFPEPERFDPERWAPEAKESRPKFSYFPFGGGTRVCIGEAFAWTEGVLVIATLAQKWRIKSAPGHTVTPQPMITLRPKGGMPMTLERR
jgi:cytochrome P450